MLAALAGWLALGLPTGFAFWRAGRPELALAMLPFAGGLALLLPLVAAPFLGGGLGGWPWQAALASGLLGLAVHALLRDELATPQATAGRSDGALPDLRRDPVALAGLALLLAVALANLVTGSALARGWPGYGWDGLAIWLVRARVLAESSALPEVLFREASIAGSHWDYPLFLPGLLAWFLRVGGLELRELAVVLGVCAALFPTAIALGLARTLRPPLAVGIALAPLAVPELLAFHYRAYADPLLVWTGLAAVGLSLAGALRWDRASLVAGGLALATAVSVKNEGMLWWIATLPGLVLLSAGHGLPATRWALGLARALAPGLLLFAAWRLSVQQLGVEESLAAQLRWDLVGPRLGVVATAMRIVVVGPHTAWILAACLVALVAVAPGRAADRLLWTGALLSVPLSFAAGLFLVYLGTPHDVLWHLSTSLHRTAFGVMPLCFAAAALATLLPRPGGGAADPP